MYGAPEEWKKWTHDRRMQWLRNQIGFLNGKVGANALDMYWRDQWIKKLERMNRNATPYLSGG